MTLHFSWIVIMGKFIQEIYYSLVSSCFGHMITVTISTNYNFRMTSYDVKTLISTAANIRCKMCITLKRIIYIRTHDKIVCAKLVKPWIICFNFGYHRNATFYNCWLRCHRHDKFENIRHFYHNALNFHMFCQCQISPYPFITADPRHLLLVNLVRFLNYT